MVCFFRCSMGLYLGEQRSGILQMVDKSSIKLRAVDRGDLRAIRFGQMVVPLFAFFLSIPLTGCNNILKTSSRTQIPNGVSSVPPTSSAVSTVTGSFGSSSQTVAPTSSTRDSQINGSSGGGVPLVLVSGTGWSYSSGLAGVLPTSCHAIGGDISSALPDPECTPGAIDVSISQGNLGATICSYGFIESLRPPFNVSEPAKYSLMKSYGYGGFRLHNYELDHLVPLELGGASTFQNLWPELNDYPAPGYLNSKDEVENSLHRAVCDGQISLQEAQDAIASNWVTALNVLGVS